MATIRQLSNGKWEAFGEAGRDSEGRRRQFRRQFDTKRAATREVARMELEVAASAKAAGVGPTLSEYCNRWLAGRRGNIAPKTFDSYECVFRGHVAGDPIGATTLADLSPTDLRDWLGRLGDKPGRGNSKLSQQTLLHVYRYLGAALTDAVEWGLLEANPLRLVETPKVRVDPSKVKAWTAEEARRFMAATAISTLPNARLWRAVFALVLATGLRRAEIAGLMWRDVDFDARTLRIQRTRLAGQSDTSPTKTDRSNRTLDLSDEALAFLAELKDILTADRALLKTAWSDSGFVVTYPDGTPPRPDMFTDRFRRDCQATGVRYVTLHGLRHSYATISLTSGESAHIVSAALGHFDVAFTLSKYAAWIPRANVEAMNRIGGHIFGTPAPGNVTRSVT